MEWMDAEGGITRDREAQRSQGQAALRHHRRGRILLLPVEKASRSRMNVVFRVAGGDEAIEKKFAEEAAARV